MSGNGHRAWQEILNKIPESFRDIVSPVLQEWDQGVQKAFEAKNAELKQYEPFKQFVDNGVDPEWLTEAADFTYNFQQNPKAVIENANRAWDLGYNLSNEPNNNQNQQELNENMFDPDDENDITKHPQFAQLAEMVNGMKKNFEQFTSKQDEERQSKEWENFLTKMHEQHGDFDDNYITALVANGQPFPQALESYQNLLTGLVGEETSDENNDNDNNNDQAGSNNDGAPVVMGGNSSGSGLPAEPISFGSMKESDLEDTVAHMISQLNNSSS